MDRKDRPGSTLTGREVLKRAALALAAGLALTALMAKPVLSKLGRRRSAPAFPKGSIYTPADEGHGKA